MDQDRKETVLIRQNALEKVPSVNLQRGYRRGSTIGAEGIIACDTTFL